MHNSTAFIRPEELWRTLGLSADQVVAHLGCGAGFYLIPAARIVGKKGQAIGVDILSDMLSEVENRARRANVAHIIRTVRGNIENDHGTTLSDQVADWVLIANVLHQSDPGKICTEAHRIVKPTGHVVVIEWDVAASPFGPPTDTRVTKAETIKQMEAANLKITKQWQPSPYHYGLIATPV